MNEDVPTGVPWEVTPIEPLYGMLIDWVLNLEKWRGGCSDPSDHERATPKCFAAGVPHSAFGALNFAGLVCCLVPRVCGDRVTLCSCVGVCDDLVVVIDAADEPKC